MSRDRGFAPVVEHLVDPLSSRFPIFDLFFEDAWSLAVMVGARTNEPPSVRRIAGASIRCIGPDQQLGGSVSGLDSSTLPALARMLGRSIRRVDLPRRLTLPEPSFSAAAWRSVVESAFAKLEDARTASYEFGCSLELEDGVRCAIAGKRRPTTWRSSRALFVVESRGRHGVTSRSRMLSLGGVAPPTREIHRVCRELIEATRAIQGSKRLRGTFPVIVGPGAGAVIFHELVGHPLEADFVLGNASPFASLEFGARVTSEHVSIVDSPDPTLGAWGANTDDEGVRSKPAPLIRRGRVVGMMHDRVSAYRSASKGTGNGRRGRFYLEPEPRMRTLTVENGTEDPEALIGTVRDGLYVARWANGRSDLEQGSFSLQVDMGWRIRNGRRREPIRGVWVRGDILDALRAVEGVGSDFAVSAEPILCAKGGVVPVGVAGPTVKFSRLEVS